MPKQIIVIMEDHYPFGECEECSNEKTRVLVRKIYQSSQQERRKLLSKVSTLRKLKNEHMIKIQSVLEEDESIHFLFEYIPIKLQTWISNINDQFIQNFRDQLINFSYFLVDNCIKVNFQLKNIGMDHSYGAKYFLDLDFVVDSTIDREKLQSSYIQQITNLFKPYIINASLSDPVENDARTRSSQIKSNKELTTSISNKLNIPDTSISPPTNRGNSTISKNKQKALAQYYQEVSMSVDSQNQKLFQEFMDVLDNDVEQQDTTEAMPQTQPCIGKKTFQKQQIMVTDHMKNISSTQSKQFQSQQINGNANKSQTARILNASNASGRGKSELKQPNQSFPQKESDFLQSRVKSAIEKSMNVIKRFKLIKDTSMM